MSPYVEVHAQLLTGSTASSTSGAASGTVQRSLLHPQQPVKQGTRPVKSAPFFEDRTLASITRADVNRYIDQKTDEGLAARRRRAPEA